MLSFNLIGSGNLGQTLGKLIIDKKLGTLRGVFNRDLRHSQAAIEFMGEGRAVSTLQDLPQADLYFVTTPDAAIETTAMALSHCLEAPASVVHCSGSLSSDILLPLKTKGCFIASAHPIHAFANPQYSYDHFAGSYCAIEGDAEVLRMLTPILEGLGAIPFDTQKADKALYHVATVFASNYLMTLAQQALSCLKSAGVERNIALELTLQLMRGSLSNLEKTRLPEAALTGPVQRAEIETIKRHLEALNTPEQKALYRLLARQTLTMTTHDEKTLAEIEQCLAAPEG